MRYRSTANRLESDWLSTIEIEVPLENVIPADEDIDSLAITEAVDPVVESTNQQSSTVTPVVKHAFERSWHVLCPDRYVQGATSSPSDANVLHSSRI